MTDIVPRLDTIEFDQLVEQARGDIPRYAPDWTDHNLHDPGMTLIDLLAWIVDQQVFRAGFVGGRHRQAFAALLGRQLTGPTPARGLIWPDRPVRDGGFVAVGSDVVCLQHIDLGFVVAWDDAVDGSLYLPPVSLVGVGRTLDGVALAAPSAAGSGGSWTLGESGRLADTTVSLRFDGPLGATGPAQVALGIEVAPPPGPAPVPGDWAWGPVTFTYRVGADRWVELDVVHDGTAGLATTGVVVLAVPPAGGATGSSELRLGFGRGFFPVAPQIRAVNVNVLPVVQLRQEPRAKLGDGNGQPDQEFALDTTDLVGATEIKVGGQVWQEQTDLANSGPTSPHYVVNPDHVLFGNGVNGRCPGRDVPIAASELARTRGVAGNLRHGLSWSVPAMGSDTYGQNRQSLAGGADRTSPDDLAVEARESAVGRRALLTDAELAVAARELAGMAVGRAEVLARFDRRLAGRRVDGVRTLVVLPAQPAWNGDGCPPVLVAASQAYLEQVAARLAPGRVLGERLVVQGPVVVDVDVAITVAVEADAVLADVERAVRRAVYRRLAAVADADANPPWPLGRDLAAVDLTAVAATVPGVRDVLTVRIGRPGGPSGADPIPVPPDGLVVAERVDVDATGGAR